MTNEHVIEVQNLVCGYEGFCLENIFFGMKRGEFIGIIGPNGSGKTTFLRAMTKIIPIRKGRILYGGKDIASIGFGELAQTVAVVTQSVAEPFMTVEEYVLLGRTPHFGKFQFLETEKDYAIAQRCMELTDTLRLKDHRLGEISGGERQLANIARALCQEPSLLLLDEPTNHLDIAHQVKILDFIKKLNRETGLTVLVVLHDLNLASEYCHRLVLLDKGRVHAVGTPEEVLTYTDIEKVYKTVVVVEKNPISAKPYVLLVSEEERKAKGEP
jgi:iron complex transport system ATP-binding protein